MNVLKSKLGPLSYIIDSCVKSKCFPQNIIMYFNYNWINLKWCYFSQCTFMFIKIQKQGGWTIMANTVKHEFSL